MIRMNESMNIPNENDKSPGFLSFLLEIWAFFKGTSFQRSNIVKDNIKKLKGYSIFQNYFLKVKKKLKKILNFIKYIEANKWRKDDQGAIQ